MSEPDYKAMLVAVMKAAAKTEDGTWWLPEEVEEWWEGAPERLAAEREEELDWLEWRRQRRLDDLQQVEREVADWRKKAAIPHPYVEEQLAFAEQRLARAQRDLKQVEDEIAAL